MANYDITTANSPLEFDTDLMANASKPMAIDSTHYFVLYAGSGSDGYAEVFTINTSTWAVTTANSRIEFDTTNGTYNNTVQIDSNHFIGVWSGSGSDGYVATFEASTSTWAVTTKSVLEFDTVFASYLSLVKIDTNHLLSVWDGNAGGSEAQVFTVNTSTWAVTTAGSLFQYDTSRPLGNSLSQIDANHFINFWNLNAAPTSGYAQVLTVNTSTWAVTTANSSLNYATSSGNDSQTVKIDTNHFLTFFRGASGQGLAQVFTVNTSTWAITTANSAFEFTSTPYNAGSQNGNQSISIIDSNHFIHAWAGTDTGGSTHYDGFVQMFEVNTSTWAVTTAGAVFEFDTTQGQRIAISDILPDTTDKVLISYLGADDDGFALVLDIEVPAAGSTGQIKTYVGGSFVAKPVKVWSGSAWVTKPVKRWNGLSWVVTNY